MALLAASGVPAAPVLGVMAAGVVIALAGHIMSDRRIVAVGLAFLFAATFAMLIFAFVAFRGDERDPRPQGSPFGAVAPDPLTRRT